MPYIGIGFSTLIAICFAIHAIRTGQSLYWLFILFVFPLFGSVVYFFAVVLPTLRHSSSAYHLESKFRKAINPGLELKQARKDVELSPTIDAQVRLAKALVDNGKYKEALPYYEKSLSGIYQTDPDILLQYAFALYLDEQFTKALKTLDYLRETNPHFTSNEGHLLYAKILVSLGDKERAQEEFDALMGYYPDLEAAAFYIQTLIQWQRLDEARKQYQDLEIRIKQMPSHSKRLNSEWIKQIKQLKSQL